MFTQENMRSFQTIARIAGVLYVIIAIASIPAHVYVPGELIVPGDAAMTANNITANEPLFLLAAGSEIIILLSEVVLSVLLYVLLRPVSKTLSLLSATARLMMTTIHGLNLLNYFFVLMLLRGGSYLTAFNSDQVNALVQLFLDAHHYGFTIGIVFLTLHAVTLGYLIFKSEYLPRILGVLFLIASVGYLIDSLGILLVPSYGTTPVYIALPIVVTELAFPLWLLIKGVGPARQEERALAST